MQKLQPRQVLKRLLLLSGLDSRQMANSINKSKLTIERWIEKNNFCIRQLHKLSIALDITIQLQLLDKTFNVNQFNRYSAKLHSNKGVTIKEAAHEIGIPTGTLKARMSRSSCTIQDVIEHFEALDEDLILIINNNKYLLA